MKPIALKTLVRGEKARLRDLSPEARLRIEVELQAPGDPSFDAGVFGIDEAGLWSDRQFGLLGDRKASPCNSVVRTDTALGADFVVDLDRVPAWIQRLAFVSVLKERRMSRITAGHFRVHDSQWIAADFPFTGEMFNHEKAVILAELYRRDGWRIAAVGQGFALGLPGLLRHFGRTSL
ncbi:MAG TPA: TerD family protein [Longimicrobium sp.]|jgi:tellurite resistance protein TerA